MTTRLGARDLLVDFRPAPMGPFGKPVERLTIPHWMSRGVQPNDQPVGTGQDEDGWHFRLANHSYVYGRWGLAQT